MSDAAVNVPEPPPVVGAHPPTDDENKKTPPPLPPQLLPPQSSSSEATEELQQQQEKKKSSSSNNNQLLMSISDPPPVQNNNNNSNSVISYTNNVDDNDLLLLTSTEKEKEEEGIQETTPLEEETSTVNNNNNDSNKDDNKGAAKSEGDSDNILSIRIPKFDKTDDDDYHQEQQQEPPTVLVEKVNKPVVTVYDDDDDDFVEHSDYVAQSLLTQARTHHQLDEKLPSQKELIKAKNGDLKKTIPIFGKNKIDGKGDSKKIQNDGLCEDNDTWNHSCKSISPALHDIVDSVLKDSVSTSLNDSVAGSNKLIDQNNMVKESSSQISVKETKECVSEKLDINPLDLAATADSESISNKSLGGQGENEIQVVELYKERERTALNESLIEKLKGSINNNNNEKDFDVEELNRQRERAALNDSALEKLRVTLDEKNEILYDKEEPHKQRKEATIMKNLDDSTVKSRKIDVQTSSLKLISKPTGSINEEKNYLSKDFIASDKLPEVRNENNHLKQKEYEKPSTHIDQPNSDEAITFSQTSALTDDFEHRGPVEGVIRIGDRYQSKIPSVGEERGSFSGDLIISPSKVVESMISLPIFLEIEGVKNKFIAPMWNTDFELFYDEEPLKDWTEENTSILRRFLNVGCQDFNLIADAVGKSVNECQIYYYGVFKNSDAYLDYKEKREERKDENKVLDLHCWNHISSVPEGINLKRKIIKNGLGAGKFCLSSLHGSIGDAIKSPIGHLSPSRTVVGAHHSPAKQLFKLKRTFGNIDDCDSKEDSDDDSSYVWSGKALPLSESKGEMRLLKRRKYSSSHKSATKRM